ncbi:Histidine N-alpha-methyltransferase [Madurella mycetomatis]|uniref:4-dimethylallyltryptophan N-methyltransferase n=1 Tax=Madurella mycetomatis TaxID=100816 RepID=A0A175W7W9_9PEZI|nr:Histidine N-alpha-methyltransferase [Madurella mycetomatis]
MRANRTFTNAQIIDIGGSRLNETLRSMLVNSMLTPKKHCVLPSALLSDDNGSFLWRDINRMPDYYQMQDEIALLELHGKDIADLIPPNALLIDLGCGDTRKVYPLLSLLDRARKPIHYYGLDVCLSSLQSTISQLASSLTHIKCYGLWGTFDDALRFVPTISPYSASPRWFLSLGSILGNDFPGPATANLARWAAILRPGFDDRMLLSMDSTTDLNRIWNSYHDPDGLFERFMRGGLENANRVLGVEWYWPEDWEVVGVMSEEYVMHRFVFRARRHVRHEALGGVEIDFPEGHEIDCYEGFRFQPEEMARQFRGAGLKQLRMWKAPAPSGIGEIT